MNRLKRRNIAEDIEEEIMNVPSPTDSPVEFLDTGSVLLNLVASGKGRMGGWPRGRVINLIGDGSSGKTIIALEFCAACMSLDTPVESRFSPPIDNIKVIYNNVEGVMDFPLDVMFGDGFRKKIKWESSNTVEEFSENFEKQISTRKEGTLILYVVDSFDALTSEVEFKAFQDNDTGGYNLQKQKFTNQFFRNIVNVMQGEEVILFIISQVRDKIGVSFGEKRYRTGGKALDFYTHLCVWLSEKAKIKKRVGKIERPYGMRTVAKAKRSKVSKPFREAEISIMFDYGIDDVTSNVNWLFDIIGKPYEFCGHSFKQVPTMVNFVLRNEKEEELRGEVERHWNEIEEKVAAPARKRKRKYNI